MSLIRLRTSLAGLRRAVDERRDYSMVDGELKNLEAAIGELEEALAPREPRREEQIEGLLSLIENHRDDAVTVVEIQPDGSLVVTEQPLVEDEMPSDAGLP